MIIPGVIFKPRMSGFEKFASCDGIFIKQKFNRFKPFSIGNNKLDFMFSHWVKIKIAKKDTKCLNAKKLVNVAKDNFAVHIAEPTVWMLNTKITMIPNSTKLHFCILKEISNAHFSVLIDQKWEFIWQKVLQNYI